MSRAIYHKHHIIPKHIGGTDDPSNMITLTIEEHAQAHLELYEKYNRWQDLCAYKALSGMIGNEEVLRIVFSAQGKKFRGISKSKQQRERMSKSAMGHIVTKETREKLSIGAMGRIPSNKGKTPPKLECQHCGSIVSNGNLRRWHGDNCKTINPDLHRIKTEQIRNLYKFR